ncbi:ubiquitin carboxy terminal hydrolase Ubp16 [Schizosaccharomyces japonicus yFS275]|uniref:Ubiquitin carboxyl-terminal hydrolase n=1 Tax=Schizosaccharomyces japonicus (strain yFS275 / FY16936) TaxID=402676 RepID=B6JWI8_SCHJY|nr:ubiquitin carboxy terminal hydrolase Ubp16 [Schizosaccharomyces japonicus yFS275]EEB05739.2 ubiquitin carboxy terminal hydrolase Ubp16 [Schizosaccharomyces japonicus yFS275]
MSVAALNGSLDFSLKHSLDDLLKNPVRFRKSTKSVTATPDGKYTPLNRRKGDSKQSASSKDTNAHGAAAGNTGSEKRHRSSASSNQTSGTRGEGSVELDEEDEQGFPGPARVLFPKENISIDWQNILPNAPGLVNLGNTCFMNSVLQLMMHTAPLVEYLLTGQHTAACRMNACVLCKMEQHMMKAYPSKGKKRASAFKPTGIQSMLKVIASHFRPYRQEDAHEFMRYLIDSWQKSCLQSFKNLDHPSRETSLIHRIFGGYLRQQITCSSCHKPSSTYQSLLDLSLEANVSNILESLSHTVARNCKTLGGMLQKQMTVYRAPNYLTLHLKRFTFNSFHSHKITKHVAYPELLDLGPFMSDANRACVYELCGVLVHAGGSTRSGHYYSFCKSSSGTWLKFDDDFVSNTSIDRVLSQQAYILLYRRKPGAKAPVQKRKGKRNSDGGSGGKHRKKVRT